MLGFEPQFSFLPDLGDCTVAYTAVQSFLNGSLQSKKLGLLRLVAAHEIAEIFTVIGVVTAGDLCFDPLVLLLGQGDCLSGSGHIYFPGIHQKSYYWCNIALFNIGGQDMYGPFWYFMGVFAFCFMGVFAFCLRFLFTFC